MTKMESLTGRITVVQEQRFRLTSESGQSYMITLHHKASVGMEELRRLQKAGTRVIVELTGEPGIASCAAHGVRPAKPEHP